MFILGFIWSDIRFMDRKNQISGYISNRFIDEEKPSGLQARQAQHHQEDGGTWRGAQVR